MAIYSSKAQFLLATSKPNFYWQYQSSILIGNIKAQFLIGNIKTRFLLATSKPDFYWQHQNPIFIGTTLSKRKRAQDYQRLAKKKYHGKNVTMAKKTMAIIL